jgi:predicted RecA/RadA family phage recombinase
MAKNYIQEGQVLTYTASAVAVASGGIVVVGARIGVALGDIALGAQGPVDVEGVWLVAKLGTDNVAQGAELYWDAANSRLTTTAQGNVKAGFAFAAAGAGVTTVSIKINA